MQPLSDEQLHNLVERVVRQTLGGMMNPVSAPVPAVQEPPKPVIQAPATTVPSNKKTVAIGTDHGGVDLKTALKADLVTLGYEVIDCGTDTKDAVDYPDIAVKVGGEVLKGDAEYGILICGTGIGMCIAANKIKGIRAANCNDIFCARRSRAHNNANVLCLGGDILGEVLALEIVNTFISTEFLGGRHQRRLDKIE